MLINCEFRPAALHIYRGAGEVNCLPAGIGPQPQGEEIGETEGSLDVQPVVGFKSDANGECRRGKSL
jgi:hypothetical protein